jgi:hypothetical protein
MHPLSGASAYRRLATCRPRRFRVGLVLSECRSTDDLSRARRPTGVEHERVADGPRLSLLDRRRVPVAVVAVALVAQKQDLEAGASVKMAPGGDRGKVEALAC